MQFTDLTITQKHSHAIGDRCRLVDQEFDIVDIRHNGYRVEYIVTRSTDGHGFAFETLWFDNRAKPSTQDNPASPAP